MSRTALVVFARPSDAPQDRDTSFSLANPDLPQLSVRDLGVTRGDGIFESISIIHGAPHALEAHLARFAHSADVLDLPAPDLTVWREAIAAVLGALDPVAEASVRVVLTRGIEGEDHPTGWAYAAPSPDYSGVRTVGVRVVLLDRGLRHDVEQTSPWLLTGAKTLSYALNRSALREAARRGADDVVFVSSDGFVLEGPSASLVYLRSGRLCTPNTNLGILEGTTQGDIFMWATSRGIQTGFDLLTPDELRATDAAWLVSSARHAAPIRAIDGVSHPVDAGLTESINHYLSER